MTFNMARHRRLILASLLCGLLSACSGSEEGEERHPVSGSVTYQGNPVQEGSVNFRNEQYAGSGLIGPDGRYTIDDGLPAGSYSVFILPPDIQTPPTFGMNQTDSPTPKEAENIPLKYRSVGTSELEKEVKAGENDIPIAME